MGLGNKPNSCSALQCYRWEIKINYKEEFYQYPLLQKINPFISILQVLEFIFQNVCFAFLRHFWWLLFKTENQSLHLIGSYETFCEVSKGFSIALDFIFACKTLTISTHSFRCMVETLLLLNGNHCSIKSFFIYSSVGAPVAITHK